jgi:hypothetical protein
MTDGPSVFLDTSVLAKWYLPEPGSERFVRFLQGTSARALSRLTLVEMQSLLGRRRRAGELNSQQVKLVQRALDQDLSAGFLEVRPVDDSQVARAAEILTKLASRPLRTLDALHLAAAETSGTSLFATADRVQAASARALGLRVRFFGRSQ